MAKVLEIAAILVEAGLLIALIIRLRKIRGIYRIERERQPYPIDALRIAFASTMGRRLGAMVFGEVAVLWYALAGWRGRGRASQPGKPFPGHRRNAYPAILGAVMMAVVVETAVLHLLVSLWVGWVAWILTGLSVYSLIWLLGDFQAARLNPSLLTESHLHLRTGLRWQADLAWMEIIGIHGDPPPEKHVKMTLFGAPEFWIECSDPTVVRGFFGIERHVRFIGLGVDDPEGFRREIQRCIQKSGAMRPPPKPVQM